MGVPASRLAPALGRAFDAAQLTQLSAFLEALAERIGPDPGGDRWKAEVVTAIKERWVQDGTIDSMDDPKYEKVLEVDPWARSFEAFCEENKEDVDAKLKNSGGSLSREEAQLLIVCTIYGGVLAAATREARPDYAGLTHAYYNLLVHLAAGADPAPDCYSQLQDTTTAGKSTGLQDTEPGWAALVGGAVAAAPEGGAAPLRGLHCMTAAGATVVSPGQPRHLAPEGYRQMNHQKGGAMEVQDSTVVRFISAGRDGAGLHTAVFTDPANCAFPPMTLFTAVDVQIGAYEYDGTEGLLRVCRIKYGGRAPMPVPDVSRDGRPHVGRQQLIEWLVGLDIPSGDVLGVSQHAFLASDDPTEHEKAVDWLHATLLPLGVESTIYTVNRTLVTVQATYLLPAAVEAAAAEAGGSGADVAGGGGGPGEAGGAVSAKHMGDSEKLG